MYGGYVESENENQNSRCWQEIFTSHKITLPATMWYFLLDTFYLIYKILLIKVSIDMERHLSSIHFLKEGALMKNIPFLKK